MPCPEQAAAQPRLQDRVQPAKYRSHHTDSGERPPDRTPAGHSQYEFLNALIPRGFSFTVALVDEEATRRLMVVDIAAALSNGAGMHRCNQFLPDNTGIVRDLQRPTGQIALHFIAAFMCEECMLSLGLDAFSQDGNIETPAEADHRANDRDRVAVGFQVGNEAPVDLYLVEGERMQIRQ